MRLPTTGRSAALAIGLFICLGAAAPAAVPDDFRGNWALGGRCDRPSARLVITGSSISFAGAPPRSVTFFEHDSPSGESALHWSEEGEVDNFVLRHDPTTIVHNTQGYGMPGAEIFKPCPR
jgi:hypothetical protein